MRPAVLLPVLLLAACALPETRTPFVDPISRWAEASRQRELAEEKGRDLRHQLLALRAVPADPRAQELARAAEELTLLRRLYRVGTRVLEATAPLCGERVVRHLGAQLANSDGLLADGDAALAELLQAGPALRVLAAAEDSPFVPGDELVAFAGTAAPTGAAARERLEALLHGLPAGGEVAVTVRRDGSELDLRVAARPKCRYAFGLADGWAVNATADGEAITFTRGMAHFAGEDDEMAIIFGHELAHNVMGHLDKRRDNEATGTIVGKLVTVVVGEDVTRKFTAAGGLAFSRGFELEADYVGIYYAARAGFDVSRAPQFWRRLAAAFPTAIDGSRTHPASPERFLALEAAVREIAAKRAANEPLVPERGGLLW